MYNVLVHIMIQNDIFPSAFNGGWTDILVKCLLLDIVENDTTVYSQQGDCNLI